jgi:hypothetical protein
MLQHFSKLLQYLSNKTLNQHFHKKLIQHFLKRVAPTFCKKVFINIFGKCWSTLSKILQYFFLKMLKKIQPSSLWPAVAPAEVGELAQPRGAACITAWPARATAARGGGGKLGWPQPCAGGDDMWEAAAR